MGTDASGIVAEWLGRRCRDEITGFYGAATGVAFYLGTAPKILIEASTPTGDPKCRWVEADRVEACEAGDLPGVYA